jgi:hypothetical protein
MIKISHSAYTKQPNYNRNKTLRQIKSTSKLFTIFSKHKAERTQAERETIGDEFGKAVGMKERPKGLRFLTKEIKQPV